MGELFGIPVVFLSAINGRPTRVFCFASVGKPANPTPTLRRFPRKCERIFVGARPQGEGAEQREIGRRLVNGLRVWWAFPVVGGGVSPTLRVYMSIGGCIANATPSPTLPRYGLRPAGEGVERREIGQWLVNGLRVWWAFPVVGGGASPTLRVYISIGGCIANATPSPALPRCGLRPAGEGAERLRECGRLMCVRNGAPRRTLWWFVGLRAAR